MVANFGMDYGVRPRMILMADQSFAEYFDKAKCIGMMYINCPDASSDLIPTEIGFNFEVEEYASKFIAELVRWVKESGDDERAIDLEFIDLNNGEYMVAFGPNREMFSKRMLPDYLEDRVDPLLFMFSKGKELSTGKNYAQFKKNYKQGRRIIVRAFVGFKDGQQGRILNEYFIKSAFSFIKEDDLTQESLGYYLLKAKNKPITKKSLKRTAPVNYEPIDNRRTDELAYFFPITIDKIRRKGWLSETIQSIPAHIDHKHIEQAICNLILTERLRKQSSDLKTTGPGHDMNILQYLLDSIEAFDSYFPEDAFFTKALIKQQLKRDKDFLTDYLSKK